MKTILETDRLMLREFILDDAQKIFSLNSDPEVTRYTGDLPFKSEKEATLFLSNYQDYKKYGFGRWAVLDKKTKLFLGWCGLKRNEENLIDLGFRFFKNEWNKGFATESATACIYYGFNSLGFDKIIGRAAQENIASIKVLEKIGMHYWKTDVCHGITNAHYYMITKEAFTKKGY
ncbi:GNAT family N-acetyltransferase [Eudoraea sp.]|uniref:GNAT family N-acetyltransferase n=1 Tax=Eudoraea sp. TaxID=1979955 RepID=UPI003C752F18